MRVPRIFTDQPLQVGQLIVLEKDPSIHLIKVLRLSKGHQLELFNGNNSSYAAEIIAIDRNEVSAHILRQSTVDNESPLQLHLYQGISRGDKMDLTLQKAVELGVKHFTPMITERCGVKLDEKRWQKKREHWIKIIQSACEQSGRNAIPTLHPVMTFTEALDKISPQSIFLEPSSENRFKNIQLPDLTSEIQLWVGPEGGFSDNEVIQVKLKGCTPVNLGPRILRTETAALAAVSCINSVWGDF